MMNFLLNFTIPISLKILFNINHYLQTLLIIVEFFFKLTYLFNYIMLIKYSINKIQRIFSSLVFNYFNIFVIIINILFKSIFLYQFFNMKLLLQKVLIIYLLEFIFFEIFVKNQLFYLFIKNVIILFISICYCLKLLVIKLINFKIILFIINNIDL